MASLHIRLVTPERVVFEKNADQVSITTDMGEITVLPGHIPLVATMRAGELRLKTGATEELFVASTGFVEVRANNEVVILADTAEREEELEIEKIETAKKLAEETLAKKRMGEDVNYSAALAGLERELARYRVAMKRKHRKS